MGGQIRTVQTVQQTRDSTVQFFGEVVDAPAVVQWQVPWVFDVPVTGSDNFQQFTTQPVQKTVDFPPGAVLGEGG